MEYVTHIQKGLSVRVPLEKDAMARHISERAKKGYYRIIDGSFGVGVDMRGKTSKHIHSYVIGGVIHYLDVESFQILQKFLSKHRLTILAKTLIEAREYNALVREYDFPPEMFHGIVKKSSQDDALSSALAAMA